MMITVITKCLDFLHSAFMECTNGLRESFQLPPLRFLSPSLCKITEFLAQRSQAFVYLSCGNGLHYLQCLPTANGFIVTKSIIPRGNIVQTTLRTCTELTCSKYNVTLSLIASSAFICTKFVYASTICCYWSSHIR